jgi:hypothetical protein
MLSREDKPTILATYEIQASDVGKATIRLHYGGSERSHSVASCLGRIMRQDVGRRLTLLRFANGAEVLQAENAEQRTKREEREERLAEALLRARLAMAKSKSARSDSIGRVECSEPEALAMLDLLRTDPECDETRSHDMGLGSRILDAWGGEDGTRKPFWRLWLVYEAEEQSNGEER